MLAALIAAVAAVLVAEGGDEGADGEDVCNDAAVAGSHNTLNCDTTIKRGSPRERTVLKGQPIPVECKPEGESVVLRASATLEVHVWCSELMPVRQLVQTKLKVWMSNPSSSPTVDVSLARWRLLVPGAAAARRWSPPPGERWPRPRVIRLPQGPVTAIPANPDGAAEPLGALPGGAVNYSFATHWKKRVLAPGETWRPPLRERATGARHLDGTLVFYVPLLRRGRALYEPRIYGLARMRGKKVLTLCPRGRWGRRVSAESF